MFYSSISKIEPKTVKITLDHSDRVQAMQNELNEFERNKVWRRIPKSKGCISCRSKIGGLQ